MKDFLTNSVFFGAAISLVAYEIGTLLKKKFKLAIFNPLLIAVICVMVVLILFHIDYDTYNERWTVYQLSVDTGDGQSGCPPLSTD